MKIIGLAEVFAVVAMAVVGCGGASSTKTGLTVVYPIAARHLVVDNSTIYFTSSDGVMRAPKEGGGSPVRLGDWSSCPKARRSSR